jgi:DNA-binding SARP family transcriptional activator
LARAYLTGAVRLVGPAGTIVETDLPGNQGRVAFAALVHERRPLARDVLADIVWGEAPPARWNGALTAIVSKLRSLVSRTGLDGAAVVTAAGGTYSVTLPVGSWVDTEDAWRRLDRAEGALRHGRADAAAEEATVASSILRREFLPGVDGPWVDQVRRHQLLGAHRCFVVLADAWTGRGDPDLAAVVAQRAIDLDPYRETGHRALIRAEWCRGDRAAALSAYARCRDVLHEELGVRPSDQTEALVAEVRGAP